QTPTAHGAIWLAYFFSSANQRKRSPSAKPRLPRTTRFVDENILGPRTAPASLPTRSTRLAAQMRRRRCGNSMGSRVLMSLGPHEPLQAGCAFCSPKSNNNGEALPAFLKSGWGCLLWTSSAKRRLIGREFPAPVVCASRGRGDPDGCEKICFGEEALTRY